MAQALLQQAIDAIRRGDKTAGQRLLAQVLRADPRSETAWLWMSQIVETDQQRLDCLRRVLAINPNNETARKGVELLEASMKPAPAGMEGDVGGDSSRRPPEPTRLAPRSQPIRPEPPVPPSSVAPFGEIASGQQAATGKGSIAAPLPGAEAAPIEAPAAIAKPAPVEKRKKAPSRPGRERLAAWRRSAVPILLVLVVVLGGGAIFAIVTSRPPEPATAPIAAAGRLAVSLDIDGDAEIALVRPDGSGLTALVPRTGADTHPAWSPDGARLAFTAHTDDTSIIAVVDANGKGFTPLTRGDARSVDPAWSPDGTRLAFAADGAGDFDIYVMPAPGTQADGVAAFNLTRFEGDDRAPAWTPDSQSIVFQSDREGQADIYSMSADGSNVTRLTDDPADDTDPAVSPDGARIAFVSTRDGDADIFVMNLDGSSPRAVTDNTVDDRAPSWTPDGLILFTSVLTDGAALFVIRPDGSELSPVAGETVGASGAAWQPVDVDPASLTAHAVPTPTVAAELLDLPAGAFAFASNRSGQFDLYTMDLDGENLMVLSDSPFDERHPALSPVAAQLAFNARVSDTQHILVVAPRVGGEEATVVTLTQEAVSAQAPAWSPDGTQIAYEIDSDGGPDIAVIQPDGSGAARLTNRPGYDGCLSWRPDGRQIAFTSDRDGSLDIYLMATDGSNVERLTRHLAADGCPAWSPDGTRIAFVSDRNGEGVYLMAADGSNARLLVALPNPSQPAWSADGRFLLVASDRDGDGDIYLIAVDAAAMRNLTANSDADEVDPMWLP